MSYSSRSIHLLIPPVFTGTILTRIRLNCSIDQISTSTSITTRLTQEFATSKDGTRIPIFLVHRKDVQKNGYNPTLLYGYGGFSIPITPTFMVNRLVWLELGGILAVANLRGGGEFGEEWHQAGAY